MTSNSKGTNILTKILSEISPCQVFFFFFFIDKKQCIDEKRSTQRVYKREPEGKQETAEQAVSEQAVKPKPTSQKTKGRADKKAPQHEANHSKKPISEKISSPMYNLFQLHKLETKECLSFCTSTIPALKTMRSRSCDTIQKMQRGKNFQIFLLFFPTSEPYQLIRASLRVLGKNQEKPTKEKKRSQRV